MPDKTSQVDGFIRKNKAWKAELEALRELALECGLTEEVKWRQPCYTVNGGIVVLFGVYKDCCVLSFLKGALLKDVKQILEKPGPNCQAARLIKFENVKDIEKMKSILKAYIREAAKAEQAGLKVDFKAKDELIIPDELQDKFDEMPNLKTAFDALTPGRRRAYVLFISGAKQSKTRTSRVEKHVKRILAGKGLND